MSPTVVCVGDVMVDVLALLPAPLETGTDTPAPISLVGGGSAANTAAWLARAGIAAAVLARVGDDALGRQATAELVAAGVRPVLAVDPDHPTGVCIVLVDVTGERTMIPAAGANERLAAADLPDAELTAAAYVHVSGYPLLRDATRDAAQDLIARARALGRPVSVDASSVAPLRAAGAERFLTAVGAPVLLFANADEAALLSGEGDPGAAARALGARCGQVIVKCGADGAVWSDGREPVRVAAAAQDAVDTTGAGDAFAAGVLAQLVTPGDEQADPTALLTAGCALAAEPLASPGGRPRR